MKRPIIRRSLALLTALVLCMSLIPAHAGAEWVEDEQTAPAELAAPAIEIEEETEDAAPAEPADFAEESAAPAEPAALDGEADDAEPAEPAPDEEKPYDPLLDEPPLIDELTADELAEEPADGEEPAAAPRADDAQADGDTQDVFVLYDGEGASATITYDANGGEGTMPAQTVQQSATSVPLTANAFTREGYAFAGWALHAELETGEGVYRAGMTVHITGDATLYAVWDEAPAGYTHLFHSAQYGNTLVTLADDGNGGWTITKFNVWAKGQYGSNDPGSPTKVYIPATYDGKPITAIGANAFKSAGLTGLRFAPDCVIATIGNYAFYMDSIGGALTLPVTVTAIGSYAFHSNPFTSVNFTALTELETIGTYSFYDNKFKSLDLTQTKVTAIPSYAFYGTPIKDPILHPQTTSIGTQAFGYRTYGYVKIPATIQTVGSGSFGVPTYNIDIDVSEVPAETIESIYPNLLGRYYDSIVKTLVIFPDSWYDNDSAFILYNGRIYGLKANPGGTITVPDREDITSMARGVFATRPAAGNYTSLVFEEGCRITALSTYLCTIQSKLKSVTFHEGLKSIGYGSFYECTGLTSLTNLPQSLTTVSDMAFEQCKNITEAVLPKNVASVGKSAFAYCYGLKKVTIGDETGSALTGKGAGAIDTSAFYFDNGLADIYVPGVTEAYGTANYPWMQYPWSATSATIHWKDDDSDPKYVEVVGPDGCHWMFGAVSGQLITLLGKEREDGAVYSGSVSSDRIDVTVPTTVYAVSDAAREHPMLVQSLNTYLLPDRTDGLKRYIGTLTVPGSYRNIGATVFRQSQDGSNSISITNVVLEEGVETIGSNSFYNAGITNLYLPGTLKAIADSAFSWAGVYHVYGPNGEGILPEGMQSLGGSAFAYNYFPEITIPSTMKTISNSAFYSASKLKKIMIMQYRDAAGMPADGVLAPAGWVGNNFGAKTVGTNVFFLDAITTEVEQVDASIDLDAQTTTVIVRARKHSGVNTLVDPYLTARSDDAIVDFHIIAPGSAEWQDDYDDEWVYVSLTVTQDKVYYFDGSFHNETTGLNDTAPVPIPVKNNFGTLAYDRNGGVGTLPDSVTKLTGTVVTVADIPDDLQRYGYMVGEAAADGYGWMADDKWNTAPDKSGTDYRPGDTIELPHGTVTLYPSWVPDPTVLYEVVYRVADHGRIADGSATSNQNIQVLTTDGVTGSKAVADRGYHVTGWFKDGVSVSTTAVLTAVTAKAKLNKYGAEAYANTIYAAGIEANAYRIVFAANGGSGDMADQEMIWNTADTLTPNAFTRTGYTFLGWNTDPDGTGDEYRDGQEVVNLTDVNNGTVTLYAQWALDHYTVTWVNEDGTTLETDENVPYGTTPSYDGTTPVKQGDAQYSYDFAGWTPEIVAVTGNATYTATYTQRVNTYTVTYLNGVGENGGKVLLSETVPYGTQTPQVDAPRRSGYLFAGWMPEIAETVTENVTYIAQWKPAPSDPTPSEPTPPEPDPEPAEPEDPGLELGEDGTPLHGIPGDPAAPPRTGDEMHTALWALLALGALAGIFVLLAGRKRRTAKR